MTPTDQAKKQQEKLCQNNADHKGIHNTRVAGEQTLAGCQTVSHQRTQKQSRRRTARDAQGNHRDEGTTHHTVDSGGNRNNALLAAVTKFFRVVGQLFLNFIAQSGGSGATRSGHNTDQCTDYRGSDHRSDQACQTLEGAGR